jgi:hypothetical protein
MTRKRLLKIALHGTLITVLSLIVVEVTLSILDPWGSKFFDDLVALKNVSQVDSKRGYILPAGHYQFSHWSVTELENGTRNVPANAGGKCQVVFVGDSMTWGYGVNDNETWVNLLAAALPEINAVNAGLYGYSSANIRDTMIDFPSADILVYLIIQDDHKEKATLIRESRRSAIEKYVDFIMLVRRQVVDTEEGKGTDKSHFISDIEKMQQDRRVLLLGLDEPPGRYLTDGLNVKLIPKSNHRISVMDIHPDPIGHREMADAILPILREAVSRQCSDKSK